MRPAVHVPFGKKTANGSKYAMNFYIQNFSLEVWNV